MEREHSDLQLHIARTDWWCENLGMWKAFIVSGEVGNFFSVFLSFESIQTCMKSRRKMCRYFPYTCLYLKFTCWGKNPNLFWTPLCFPSGYYDAFTVSLLRHCCNGVIKITCMYIKKFWDWVICYLKGTIFHENGLFLYYHTIALGCSWVSAMSQRYSAYTFWVLYYCI